MALELRIGDIVRMKKSHPCGNNLWEVTRLGADIGIVCQQCRRYVMLPRPYLERRVREVLPRDLLDRNPLGNPLDHDSLGTQALSSRDSESVSD